MSYRPSWSRTCHAVAPKSIVDLGSSVIYPRAVVACVCVKRWCPDDFRPGFLRPPRLANLVHPRLSPASTLADTSFHICPPGRAPVPSSSITQALRHWLVDSDEPFTPHSSSLAGACSSSRTAQIYEWDVLTNALEPVIAASKLLPWLRRSALGLSDGDGQIMREPAPDRFASMPMAC